MKYTSILKLSILGYLCIITTAHAHAATLRTTMVDSINSIRLESATSSVIEGAAGQPVAFFAVTFSIEAFRTPVAIPVHTRRNGALVIQYPIEYTFFGRDNAPINTGYAAAVLVSENSTGTDAYIIPPGKRHIFTLYAMHADNRKNRADERMRITALPIATPGQKMPIRLNPSETQELVSPVAWVLD